MYFPNLDKINDIIVNILKLKQYIDKNSYISNFAIEKFSKNKELLKNNLKIINDINTQLTTYIELFNRIKQIILLQDHVCFSTSYQTTPLFVINKKLIDISNNINELSLWFDYIKNNEKIEQYELTNFLTCCKNNNIPLKALNKAFETQFLRLWINGVVFSTNPNLKNFNGISHKQLINEFKKLDKQQIEIAQSRLLEKLYNNIINIETNFFKECSTLKRVAKLQRTKKSLRQIINSIPNIFQLLKPCIMMSPMTVSQFLDSEIFNFDVIIFDEASQLTTEDCIGAILRGNKLIVAGDTKQLPPTSFFKTITSDDDNENDENSINEREDLDSILDECTTSGFPQCMLKWHYRSKHEHLIAFSNKHLYQELYTFPNAIETSDSLGIKFNYFEPISNTKENKSIEEAKIIAQAIMHHAKLNPTLSLGVATLNIKQKNIIEDELYKLRNEKPEYEDFFDDNKKESFFIKNLESIQGDERDIIMISIGYFKGQNGKLSMNFGPINRDGGERRLNVLITRARYKIEIFSAIKASDFNMDNTSKRGVQLLQWYLDFAERGEIALEQNISTIISDHFDLPFEEFVCQELRLRGYDVKTQIGCSGYKIDLAIRDKNNPGKFILGIECDGASYHSSATARDRDRLRQEILEKLGWKIYRIWSTDWFKNPKQQIDKLLYTIENLK